MIKIKCPSCLNDMAVIEIIQAHEKVKVTAYCGECDVDIEVISGTTVDRLEKERVGIDLGKGEDRTIFQQVPPHPQG
ncbi:hypothetical protein [Paenibacillus ehimensis]|uniref:hypothetical protein n=1 Tax=Paenibacillus ehimensis TaxID=79264 RepID=UPI002676F041|nr:hypothetical protein [Paenibacillus ehimensis]